MLHLSAIGLSAPEIQNCEIALKASIQRAQYYLANPIYLNLTVNYFDVTFVLKTESLILYVSFTKPIKQKINIALSESWLRRLLWKSNQTLSAQAMPPIAL